MKKNKKKRGMSAEGLEVTTKQELLENQGEQVTPYQALCAGVIDDLNKHYQDCQDAADKLANNGWQTGPVNLQPIGNPVFSGFWPGVTFVFNADYTAVKSAPAMIVNTVDQGPVYAVPNGTETEYCCPVVAPVIVGNTDRPTGIYVPTNASSEAISAGIEMLESYKRVCERIESQANDDFIEDECHCPICITEEATGINWEEE